MIKHIHYTFIMNSLVPFSKGTDAKRHYSILKCGTNAVWFMAGCLKPMSLFWRAFPPRKVT
jgi:hypothetical protein